ncbi:MAG: MATE family efflux transporter, partial [Erysipelotrichaceae bacterium]|nr:MATE family efflux transporter [Erysipelotrichaceae bacterium]
VDLMMRMININDTLYPIAYDYLRVYLIGNMAVFMYNIGFYILRSMGDSKHPLYYLIASSVINIVLGVIFVRKFQMMATGTALSTIISQFVVDILVFRLLAKKGILKFDIRTLKINWSVVKEIFRLGIPAGVQNALIAMAGATVQAYTNLFPNEVIAGIGVAQRVVSYAQSPLHGLTNVSTSLIGQNYGAGKYERVREGTSFCIKLANTMSIVLSVLVFIFARPLVVMFNKDPEIVKYGVEMVRYTVFSTIFIGWSHVYNGVCRGAGNVKLPLVIAVTSQVIIRYVYVVLAFKHSFSIYHIYVANSIGFVTAGIFATLYFRFSKWTKTHHLRV